MGTSPTRSSKPFNNINIFQKYFGLKRTLMAVTLDQPHEVVQPPRGVRRVAPVELQDINRYG